MVSSRSSRPLTARGQRTMRRLMDAGLAVLAEQGWHDASVDAVVERAGTSHGAFYQYFANMQELLVALAHECATVMIGVVDGFPDVAASDSRAAVRDWLVTFLDDYERYRGVVRAWMESQVDHPDLERLGQEVMAAYAERFAQVSGGDSLRAAALLALLERLSYGLSSRGVRIGRERVLDTLTTIVHRGFFSPAAPAAPSF